MAAARSWEYCEDTTYVPGKPQISRLMADHIQVYLNIVLDEALEEKAGGEKVRIGMVVIRGNAVVMLEVRTYHYHFILGIRLIQI